MGVTGGTYVGASQKKGTLRLRAKDTKDQLPVAKSEKAKTAETGQVTSMSGTVIHNHLPGGFLPSLDSLTGWN